MLTILVSLICCTHSYGWSASDDTTREMLSSLVSSDKDIRQQALDGLADSRDSRVVPFLQNYAEGAVFVWNNQVVVCTDLRQTPSVILDPLTLAPVTVDGHPVQADVSELRDMGPSGRAERKAVADTIRLLEIWMPDLDTRLAAVQRLGDSRDPKFLESLNQLIDSDAPDQVKRKAIENALLIRISGNIQEQTTDDRLLAIREIGELCVARAVPTLKDILTTDEDSHLHAVCQQALATIESYQKKVLMGQ